MKVTIYDVAELAKVSPATVSRVLTNKSNVNEQTKQSILDAMEELGYRYKQPRIKTGRVGDDIILVITGDTSSKFFTSWYESMHPIMREAGYTVLIAYSSYFDEIDEAYLRYAQKNVFAGAFLVTPTETDSMRELLQQKNIPLVLVNRPLRSADLDAVCQDHYRSGYQAISHLIDNGHRDIVCVLGRVTSTGDAGKSDGAKAAMRDAGLDENRLRFVYAGFSESRAYDSFFSGEFDDSVKGATAIFCGNESMARGVINAQYRLGREVPRDLSVIVAASAQFSMHATTIATVQQNAPQMGVRSAELMLERVNGKNKGDELPQKIVMPPLLVVGESVAKIG